MLTNARPVAFTDSAGQAVMVKTHTLEPREAEATSVRDDIAAELAVTKSQAAMLVVPALAKVDPEFVEWLTCGAMQYVEAESVGRFVIDPSVAAWALAVIESGKVW